MSTQTIKYAKTLPIGTNDAGYDVIVDGVLVGKVFRYDGQSARRSYTDWTAYLVDEDGQIEAQAQAIKATREAAVAQMLRRRAERIVKAVVDSVMADPCPECGERLDIRGICPECGYCSHCDRPG
jgi:hypothetical protein